MAPPPTAPIVSLRGVGKVFGTGTVALDGFDLDVREGEFLSLLGPSGCGKSTALRIIAGLSDPSRGTVLWRDGADARRGIGFVFQEPTLMPWTTVFGNVFLPLKLTGVDKAAAAPRVVETLSRVGLADFADAYPRELSGGMRMRVSIARALVTAPRVLLMDEPFAALDEITRSRLNADVLAWWAARQLSVLFVTHSVYEAVFLSQRVLVMSPRPGRIVAEVRIDQPYPRDATFRTSAPYLAGCRDVSDALEAAQAQALS